MVAQTANYAFEDAGPWITTDNTDKQPQAVKSYGSVIRLNPRNPRLKEKSLCSTARFAFGQITKNPARL